MTSIVTRTGKGTPLSISELDANFTNLNTDKVEKTRVVGVASGDLTVTNGGSLTQDIELGLPDTGVSAGTLNNSATQTTPFTVDEKGRITGTSSPVTLAPDFANVANKPTTLAGYGITDAQTTITGAASTIDTEDLTASRALASNSSGKVAATAVTATELGYLAGVGQNLQTQLDGKQGTSEKDQANGYAGLNASGKLSDAVIPDLAISDYLGEVANETAMLALTGQKGDWCTRADAGTIFVITGNPATTGGWMQMSYPGTPVKSVAGKTGIVTLDKTDVGLSALTNDAQLKIGSNLSDLADASAARDNLGVEIGADVQAWDADLDWLSTNLTVAGKALLDDASASAQRTTLGLGNVDNTSDANKPVSTATQTALDDKQNLDAELTALAGLTSAANKLPYFTGAGTASLADLSSFGRSLIDDNTAATARTTLGLVIGTDVQAYDADLTDFAGKTAPTGTVVGTTDTQTLTNKTLTSPTISGGTVNNTAIGGTTPAAGAFTTLSSTGNTTLGDASGDTLTINAGTTTFAQGTANGVLYLNGSKAATSGAGLVFDGSSLSITSGASGTPALKVYGAGSAQGQIQFGGTASYSIQGGPDYLGLIYNVASSSYTHTWKINSSSVATITSKGLLVDYTSDSGLSGTGNAIFSGNVGIGTSSPTGAKLESAGIGALIGIKQNATGSTCYYRLDNTVETGGKTWRLGYTGAAGIPTFSLYNQTDNVLCWLSDASGNLGLGVTPSGWSGAYKAIDVASNASFGGATSTSIFNNSYDNGSGYIYKTSSYAQRYQLNNLGQHIWFTAPSGTAGNAISFTQAMTLDASGNLGVGTSSPGAKFEVLQTSTSTPSVNLRYNSTSLYGQHLMDANGIYVIQSPASNGVTAGALKLATNGGYAYLDSSGNLGLGVTPSAWDSGGNFTMKSGGTIFSNSGAISFGTNAYYNSGWKYAANGYATNFNQNNGTHSWLIAGNNTSGAGAGFTFTQAMTLDASGNLYIGGTVNPYAATASGSSYLLGAGSGGEFGAYNTAATNVGTVAFWKRLNGAGNFHVFYVGGNPPTAVGSITYNGTNVLYNQTSDQRLKTNITPAGSAIQSILDFPVDQFDWISSGEHQDFGGVAQKIIPIIPEMVSVPEDPEEMMGVDWSKAVPRLIRAYQELHQEIEQLKSKLN